MHISLDKKAAPVFSSVPEGVQDWLEPSYDYAAIASLWKDELKKRAPTLWRYQELLPVKNKKNIVSFGEGFTPLLPSSHLSGLLGSPTVFFKDERQGPTHSFKDRQAAVAMSYCVENQIRDLVLASAGNAALAYAAYGARAGIRLWIFLNSQVSVEKRKELELYGAHVRVLEGTYDAIKEHARAFAREKQYHFDQGVRELAAKESMKTIAFELAEQLGAAPFTTAPDWYVQAVSGGLGPVGVWKGFYELYRMGCVDKIPRLALIQAEGCAPMVRSYLQKFREVRAVAHPRTKIAPLSTGSPGPVYALLRSILMTQGGAMEMVSDVEAEQLRSTMAKKEGLAMELAPAAACAGFAKLVGQKCIRPGETVVINCSGYTQLGL